MYTTKDGNSSHLKHGLEVIIVMGAASANPVMISLSRFKFRAPGVSLFQELIGVSFGKGIGLGDRFSVPSLKTGRRFIKRSGKRHRAQEGKAHDLACDDHDASSMDV